MMTEIRSVTGKLSLALALWALAFASVARAQAGSSVERRTVSSERHAPSDALVSLNQDTDHITSEIRTGSPQDLTLAPTADSAIAGDILATGTWDAAADNDPAAEPLLMAHAGEGPLGGMFPKSVVFPPGNCSSVTPQYPYFPMRFQRAQPGFFVTDFDAIPGAGIGRPGAVTGAVIGIAQLPDHQEIPAYILFEAGAGGIILARNGDNWDWTTTIVYTPGMKYHFRVFADAQTQTYSVFVTPEGGTQQTLAKAFKFGYTPTPVTSFDYWALYTFSDQTLKVCNFVLY
jgi:hypothetical protein